MNGVDGVGIECKAVAVLLILSAVIIIISMLKSKHFFKAAILSCLQGVAALFAVNLLTSFTGVSIAVNYITLAICAVSGIAGVVLLLACNSILR